MHAYALKITCNLSAHFIDNVIILDSTQGHLIRERNRRIRHAHAQSPFPIKGNQQRYLTCLLVFIEHIRMANRASLKDNKTT